MASLEVDVTVRGTALDARTELVAFEVMQGGRLMQAFVADPSKPVTLPRRLDRIKMTTKVR